MCGGILYLLITNINSQAAFSQKERLGIEYINPVRKLLVDVHRHREIEKSYLNGDKSLADAKSDLGNSIKSDINEIDAVNDKLKITLKTSDLWNSLKQKSSDLVTSSENTNAKESYIKHTEVINDIINLIAKVGDSSNLILDPDLDSYYLMDEFIIRFPYLLDRLAVLKDTVNKMIATNSSKQKPDIIAFSTLIGYTLDSVAYDMDVIFENNPSVKTDIDGIYQNFKTSAKNLVKLTDSAVIRTDNISVKRDYYNNVLNKAYEDTVKLYDANSISLDKVIKARVDKYENQKPVAVYFTLGGLLIITYLFVAFYFSVKDAISVIENSLSKIAQGDLTVNVSCDNKDEIGDISKLINSTVSNLNSLLRTVDLSAKEISDTVLAMSQAADQTAQGSQQVANSINHLAGGAQEQAFSINESLNNINIINKSIQNILADSANTVKISKNNENNAIDGKNQAGKAITKINQIKTSSAEISGTIDALGQLAADIGQIVDLIKGIASQTNLLALNAAIEAARAGDHGKGFAVVADEVKKLAEQSENATDKIIAMVKEIQSKTSSAVGSMDNGLTEVAEGVVIIEDTGKTLEQILGEAKETSRNVDQISSEISALATNSDKVVGLMESLYAIVEESSASAEEISSVTEEQTASMQEVNASAQNLSGIVENL